ncbi:transposase [Komagataeibacter intermedius AF2]|uniref:Transposase n=1 Tax=Komagataeibacter intermedius AF2 TaxID=1458464 RepID=A0A0N0MGG9_9PROT|nr:transposase [Komagataeibacter intermedius AF2]
MHDRIITRSHGVPGRTVYDWRHYLAVIQRKPGALRNGAPFTELPIAFRTLQDQLLRRPGGDREMAEILALVLQHDEQAWQDLPAFPDLGALNAWLEARCLDCWERLQHIELTRNIAEVHASEHPHLMVPGRRFDGFVEQTKRVSPTCLIQFEGNRYSVPASFANRPISLRVLSRQAAHYRRRTGSVRA